MLGIKKKKKWFSFILYFFSVKIDLLILNICIYTLHVIMGGETCCTPLIESPTNTRSAHLYICGCMLVRMCVDPKGYINPSHH